MAEYELRAGAKVELLSSAEMSDEFDKLRKLLETWRRETAPTIRKASHQLTTDAAGNIGGGISGPEKVIYRCPVGYEAFIHRLRITATGYTPAAPLTTGQAYIGRNGPSISTVELFLPVSGTVAPVIITEGSNSAVQLLSGETLVIYGSGLPNNLAMFFGLQLRLWPSKSNIVGAG
jgi:hypothetical protein